MDGRQGRASTRKTLLEDVPLHCALTGLPPPLASRNEVTDVIHSLAFNFALVSCINVETQHELPPNIHLNHTETRLTNLGYTREGNDALGVSIDAEEERSKRGEGCLKAIEDLAQILHDNPTKSNTYDEGKKNKKRD